MDIHCFIYFGPVAYFLPTTMDTALSILVIDVSNLLDCRFRPVSQRILHYFDKTEIVTMSMSHPLANPTPYSLLNRIQVTNLSQPWMDKFSAERFAVGVTRQKYPPTLAEARQPKSDGID